MDVTRLQFAHIPVAEVIEEHGVAAAIQMKHVASVLYSYRCTLTCLHCCFNSSPRKPDVHVGLEDGLDYLRQLHATDRVVHIAGGEAMMYYDDVLRLCREANREGVTPSFIETNATWCTSRDLAVRRLSELREAGVLGLLLSACPFHQRECPPERYAKCFEAAVDVFGDRNVMGGRLSMDQLNELVATAHDEERLANHARSSGVCLVGRAGYALARYRPDRPIADLAADPMWHGTTGSMGCALELDPETMWEIHIDAYANVQTCCGIILGNLRAKPLSQYMAEGFHTANPLVRAAYEAGPVGLLEIAKQHGYEPREGYPQKCGMCFEIRRFLRSYYPETFGPAEVYEDDWPPDVARGRE